MQKINSLTQLISELNKCDDGKFGEIMKRFSLSEQTIAEIEKTCIWSNNFYTRNLLNRTSNYELLFLCWEKMQMSPVHNHSGQGCWVQILQGRCEEKMYILNEATNQLKLISSNISEKNSNDYIDDSIALHSLQNIGDSRMITLHLYSNPIDSCFVFDMESGQKKLIQTHYDNILEQKSLANLMA